MNCRSSPIQDVFGIGIRNKQRQKNTSSPSKQGQVEPAERIALMLVFSWSSKNQTPECSRAAVNTCRENPWHSQEQAMSGLSIVWKPLITKPGRNVARLWLQSPSSVQMKQDLWGFVGVWRCWDQSSYNFGALQHCWSHFIYKEIIHYLHADWFWAAPVF